MSTKKERMYNQITKHGMDLIKIFGLDPKTDPVALCKRLKRIETSMHRTAENYCNGLINCDQWEKAEENAIQQLTKILGKAPYHIQGDPRGKILLLEDDYVAKNNLTIFRNLGGYGVICPTFDGE